MGYKDVRGDAANPSPNLGGLSNLGGQIRFFLPSSVAEVVTTGNHRQKLSKLYWLYTLDLPDL